MSGSRITKIILVGGGAEFAAVASEAGGRAFPEAAIVRVAALEQALGEEAGAGGEVLVLGDPSGEVLAAARGAMDGAGLPRWPVVVLGRAPEAAVAGSAYVVAREEWAAPLVARLFRAAIDGHALLRENARLRGDIGTFGHRIAHDLRTPLGGVLTTAEMLAEILAEHSPEDAALVRPIVDSAEGLVRTIDRMSVIAKALASNEPARRVDMGAVFWNAFQHLEGRILKAGAVLTHAQQWPAVNGHAGWLEVVWRNLLTNSLEHAGPAPWIEAGWTAAGGENRFWVRDAGRVPVEKRATLFLPFHQRSVAGAPHGLGLAMVERLVALDGGRCGFEETAGGGACFYFLLPAADA